MASEYVNDTVQSPAAEPFEPNQHQQRRPISEAQMNANKQNAQKAHGATSEAGHAASSMNALTHGMCSMKVLLPGESGEAYESLITSHFARNSPQTDEERELVQIIADNTWRLLRVPREEQSMLTVSEYECADICYTAEKDPIFRAALIRGHVVCGAERKLMNLRLHERRIRKQIADDTAKLKEIQKERIEGPARAAKEAEEENFRQVTRILAIAKNAVEQKVEFVPSDFGFDLSVSEFEEFRRIQQTHFNLSKEVLDIQTIVARVKSTPSAA
jgi:hypothetical protein